MKSPKDILQSEIGDENYAYIERQESQFKQNLEKEIYFHRFQYATTGICIGLSIGIGYAVAKNKVNIDIIQAVSAEISLMVAGFLGHYLSQEKRLQHYEKLEDIINGVRRRIPEHSKLIAEQVLEELGMQEDRLPAKPEQLSGRKFIHMSVRSAVEKLLPFIASLFI